MAEMVKL